jgi:hypothetical protein
MQTVKTLIDRVREPDADLQRSLLMLCFVAPISLSVLALGVFAMPILAGALFGVESRVAMALEVLASFVLQLTIWAFVLTVVGLWILRAYVAARLRRRATPPHQTT